MIKILLSFVAGFVLFPLIYACLPSFAGEVCKRKKPCPTERTSLPVSDALRAQLIAARIRCTDVAWLNVLIQRIFAETVRNFAFETRIRTTIVRSFASAISAGLVHGVRVITVDFGAEAPYFKDIRVLGPEELESLVAKNEVENGNKQEYNDKDNTKNGLFRHANTTKPDILHAAPSKQQRIVFEETDASAAFQTLVLAAATEYAGGCRVALEVELPRKIFVGATIALRGFAGDILIRVPAVGYDTRYELAFARDPGFVVETESGLSTGKPRVLFQASISRLLRRVVTATLRRTVVYPHWYQQLQGFLPSARDVEHRIERVTPSTIERTAAIAEAVLTLVSNDFRIVSERNGVCHRRSAHLVNAAAPITQSHFTIPGLGEGGEPTERFIFEGLAPAEARLLNRLADLNPLTEVFSGFRGLRTTYTARNSAIITLSLRNREYEFIRIVFRDALIFQRNDAASPDFFVFRVARRVLSIFAYGTTPEYAFTPRRIERLRRAVFAEPPVLLGSQALYRVVNFRRGKTKDSAAQDTSEKTNLNQGNRELLELEQGVCSQLGISPKITAAVDFPGNISNSSTTSSFASSPIFPSALSPASLSITDLEEAFREALKIDSSTFIARTVATGATSVLLHVLHDLTVRMRLFSETGHIVTTCAVSPQITSTTIENIKTTATFPLTDAVEQLVVHSYLGSDFIVDLCPARDAMFIHRLEQPVAAGPESVKDNPPASLRLLAKRDARTPPASYFVEALQLRVSHERFLELAASLPLCSAPARLVREIRVPHGTVYFEFEAEHKDDFQLKVTSCKRRTPLLQIHRIVSTTRFRILVPTESDFLRFVLIPRHGHNTCIHYRLSPMEILRDVFVDGTIGLTVNAKFVLPIKGFPTHVIFWERESDSSIKSYLEDHDSRNIIDGCGIIRAECRDYWLVYKNKGKTKQNVRLFLGMTLK